MSSQIIKVAYIGQVAPFEPEFYNQPGYGRAGTLAQLGFIEALHDAGLLDEAWGFRPIAHWPKAKIQFEASRKIELPCGAKLTLMPLINYFVIKEISRYFIIAWKVISWSMRQLGKRRIIVSYNLTQPNGVVLLRILTWLTHTKLVPIVYDLARLTMFKKPWHFRMVEPDWLDRLHERTLPLCDGLMPITDAIPRDFAPHIKYLRVDGGVGDAVVKTLPDIVPLKRKEFVIFYAGALDPWNGISLLLEFMRYCDDPDLKLHLAGSGKQESEVRAAAAKDSRIKYFGFLSHDELSRQYAMADVLVSLRDLIDPGLIYHYPSKTFEMLAMGKPLIVSNSSHTKAEYGEYCKVVDKCDLEDFVAAIDYFKGMNYQARFEYGVRAREFSLRCKHWRNQSKAIGDYIRSIA